MSIYVVRHGETLFNKLEKNQGWIDSDLTQEGIKKIKANFGQVNLPYIDKIYCSDLGRAKKTLSILYEYIEYNRDEIYFTEKLRERFLGSFEGDYLIKSRNKIANKAGYSNVENLLKEKSFWEFVDLTYQYDELNLAEDYIAFSTRLNSVIESIVENKTTENILLVAHANPIRYLVEYLTQKESQLIIENGSILKIDKDFDKWAVEKLV